MLNTVSRIRGQGKSTGYPQTEGMLGECMLHHSQELGAASEFGLLLGVVQCGLDSHDVTLTDSKTKTENSQSFTLQTKCPFPSEN